MYEYIARFCHRNRTDLMRGILDFVPLMRYHLEFAFQRLNCFSVTVIFFIISFDFGSSENITVVIFYSLLWCVSLASILGTYSLKT